MTKFLRTEKEIWLSGVSETGLTEPSQLMSNTLKSKVKRSKKTFLKAHQKQRFVDQKFQAYLTAELTYQSNGECEKILLNELNKQAPFKKRFVAQEQSLYIKRNT